MTDLALARAAIESALDYITPSTVGGASPLELRWRGRHSDWRSDHALLHISAMVTLGRDEVLDEYDSQAQADEQISQFQRGARTCTLGVQVRTHRQSDGLDAVEYTRRIRDRILLPSVRSILAAADVSVARILDDRDLSEVVDSRELSIAQIDIRLNMMGLEADVPSTWIEWVEYATGFIGPDDSPVADRSGTMQVG